MTEITADDIKKLLTHFALNNSSTTTPDAPSTEVLRKCIELMKTDYKLINLANTAGELCPTYPRHILIPDSVDDGSGQFKYEMLRDTIRLKETILKANTARCRLRFPIPVIRYKSKYVCRSATLSGMPEVYGRSGINYVFYGVGAEEPEDNDTTAASTSTSGTSYYSSWSLVDHRRQYDIALLRAYNVYTIVDLMVENKKVKYMLRVSSSEKVDKENRYAKFNIMSMPYPGCEYFHVFKKNNHSAVGMVFNWEQGFCDATLNVPNNKIVEALSINWHDYMQWDLVRMTQNYMKLILRYLEEDPRSILVHCISGWDRTPLYISMLRLSLWADGVIHKNLNAYQILYLTIGYDWYLFGHQLTSRLYKEEDVFYFCFYMLKHLTRGEYSVLGRRACGHKCNDCASSGSPSMASSPLPPNEEPAEIDEPSVSPIPPDGGAAAKIWLESLELPESDDEKERDGSLSEKHSQGSSSSSSSSGWQMLMESESHSTSSSSGHNTSHEEGELTSSQESVCTVIEVSTGHGVRMEPVPQPSGGGTEPVLKCRKKRLNEVREIFNTCYEATVMQLPKDDSSIVAKIGNLAERVGLTCSKS